MSAATTGTSPTRQIGIHSLVAEQIAQGNIVQCYALNRHYALLGNRWNVVGYYACVKRWPRLFGQLIPIL
jgi:hypothetical protein